MRRIWKSFTKDSWVLLVLLLVFAGRVGNAYWEKHHPRPTRQNLAPIVPIAVPEQPGPAAAQAPAPQPNPPSPAQPTDIIVPRDSDTLPALPSLPPPVLQPDSPVRDSL